MRKRISVLFVFVLALSGVFTVSASVEEQSFFKMPLEIHLSQESSDENLELLELYYRGVSLFSVADYMQAREGFSSIVGNEESSEALLGSALWGRAWSNAYLGDNEALIRDLNAIAELIELYESCECKPALLSAFNGNSYEILRVGGAYDPVPNEYCFNTVDNCSAFLKTMCVAVKCPGARTTLALFIDALADKAKSCCRAGGFWRNCVQKMVDTMNKWKVFGIPPDPYWD